MTPRSERGTPRNLTIGLIAVAVACAVAFCCGSAATYTLMTVTH